MATFSASTDIPAKADDVFSFVTDFSRMAEYLPTLKKASPVGDGQIRLQGEVDGHNYDTVGWYQTHEWNRTMLWGAPGDHEYSGDLEVIDFGDACRLTVNLKFGPNENLAAKDKNWPAHIQEGLDEALKRVREACTQEVPVTRGYVS